MTRTGNDVNTFRWRRNKRKYDTVYCLAREDNNTSKSVMKVAEWRQNVQFSWERSGNTHTKGTVGLFPLRFRHGGAKVYHCDCSMVANVPMLLTPVTSCGAPVGLGIGRGSADCCDTAIQHWHTNHTIWCCSTAVAALCMHHSIRLFSQPDGYYRELTIAEQHWQYKQRMCVCLC